MEVKAQVERYAQQKAEEEAILRAAEKARKAQDKYNNKVSAEDMARVQGRVRDWRKTGSKAALFLQYSSYWGKSQLTWLHPFTIDYVTNNHNIL